jgi:peptidoglycan/xylan/chitin deacetylase (PgdA/CDA1 family)
MNYAQQLISRWGISLPRQFYRMLKLHTTPFSTVLRNMFDVLDRHDAKFAFPIVASVASTRPELLRDMLASGHEVASHGFNHIRYSGLSALERERDLAKSLKAFGRLSVAIKGFRAPYDNYTDDMPLMLNRHSLLWDGGFGYRPDNRSRTHFFRVRMNEEQSETIFIPLNVWSDDLMIDRLGMRPEQIVKQLRAEADRAAAHEGVLMFDLHPIRIGQRRYITCLDKLLEHAMSLGAWCPTPAEAVKYWSAHGAWRGDSRFCMLLTGDIDNWVFADYIRRRIWQSMSP